MKIALTTPLPEGWERETDPEGNVVYHYQGINKTGSQSNGADWLNISNDELTTKHPLEIFFRKTFANVVKHQMDESYANVIKNTVIDELSRIKLEDVEAKKLAQKKNFEILEQRLNRKIVMGSSIAIGLLARFSHFISDVPLDELSSRGKVLINDYKPNKLKFDGPVKIVDACNRSEKRFHWILKHIKNKSMIARNKKCDLDDTLNSYFSKLEAKYKDNYRKTLCPVPPFV